MALLLGRTQLGSEIGDRDRPDAVEDTRVLLLGGELRFGLEQTHRLAEASKRVGGRLHAEHAEQVGHQDLNLSAARVVTNLHEELGYLR